MIDPRLDIVVWGAVLLLLLLMGARAWAVETAEVRHYRTSARVRVLNAATALALVVLVGLMAMQGGVVLVEAIATRTDPETFVTVVGEDDNTDQAVPDPDDQPDQPDQPAAPADPNPPAAPGGAATNPGGANTGGANTGGAANPGGANRGGAPAAPPAGRPGG